MAIKNNPFIFCLAIGLPLGIAQALYYGGLSDLMIGLGAGGGYAVLLFLIFSYRNPDWGLDAA